MDDFFRIPKKLCYFMVKHPSVDVSSTETLQWTKKLQDCEKRESVEISGSIRESTSDDSHCPTMATSRKKKVSETEKLRWTEDRSGTIEESRDWTESPIDCSSFVEATILLPVKKRKSKNTCVHKNVEKKKSSARVEKSEKIVSTVKEPSARSTDDEDLDEISLDLREKGMKKRKRPAKTPTVTSFECETCGRSFPRKGDLRIHMVNHSTVKSHKCDICEKLFKRKSALKTHMPLHSGAKYNCDECDYVTTSKVAVRYHVRRMHRKDFRYKCEQCGKCFMSNCELKDHKTSHLGTKSFICEFCGKGFLQRSSLTAHKRSVHGVVQKVLRKEHECKICKKLFASEYLMTNHVGIHSRKFLCTRCGKEFATNNGLQLHNRMHTGERPFQCRYCSKSFVRSNALAVHQLTHTGERPYVCDLCGKSFTQRTTMMAHRKKHPGNHPPPPPTLLRKLDSGVESNS